MKGFSIKPGYTIGRVRRQQHHLPGFQVSCYSWFDVGIRNDKTNELYQKESGDVGLHYDEAIGEAFVLKEDDLENIAWLLYGGPSLHSLEKPDSFLGKEIPECSSSIHKFPCYSKKREIPPVADGQITIDDQGRKILHRFSTIPGTFFATYYHQLYITEDGNLIVDSEEIHTINTGIIY